MVSFVLTSVLKPGHTGLFGGCFSSGTVTVNSLFTSGKVGLLLVCGEWLMRTEDSGQCLASGVSRAV